MHILSVFRQRRKMLFCLRELSVIVIAVVGLLLGLSAHAAPDDTSGQVKPLQVCLDPHNPPFSMRDGERHGIYFAVAEQLAEALGRPLEVYWWPTNIGMRAIRLTVLAGRCEAIFGVPFKQGLMGPDLLVAGPLLDLSYAIVSPKSASAGSLDDLAGKRVAVVFNTPPQNVLAMHPDIEAVTFRQSEQALDALATGEVDAAFVWDAFAAYAGQTAGRDWRIVRASGPRMRWRSAIGLARANRQLRDQLQTLLKAKRAQIDAIAASYGLPAYDRAARQNVTQRHLIPVTAKAGGGKVERGRKLFNAVLGCSHCHGPDAHAPDRSRDLRLMRSRYGSDWERTYWETVRNGRMQTVSGLVMPAWEGKASQEELEAIRAYIADLQQ